jgi:hypothetical protein
MSLKNKMKRGNMKNKKGQLAIFIILALAILIVLVLLFINRGVLPSVFTTQSPVEQIRSCIGEGVKPGLAIIGMQGGSLEPSFYYLYQGNKVDYLCYTEENYKGCIMQKPFLKQSVEGEIKKYIEPRARDCINAAVSSLQKNGYSVDFKKPEISVTLIPNSIIIEANLDLNIVKGSKESYKSIKTDVSSSLYDLTMIASSIGNWEARYGDAETMNYMVYYPSLRLEKKIQGDGTKIYILTDKNNLEKLMFASRSYAIPSGLTGQ